MSVYYADSTVTKVIKETIPPLIAFVAVNEFKDKRECSLFSKVEGHSEEFRSTIGSELDISLNRTFELMSSESDGETRVNRAYSGLKKSGYYVDITGARPVIYIAANDADNLQPVAHGINYRLASGTKLYKSLSTYLKATAILNYTTFNGEKHTAFEVAETYPNVSELLEQFPVYASINGIEPPLFVYSTLTHSPDSANIGSASLQVVAAKSVYTDKQGNSRQTKSFNIDIKDFDIFKKPVVIDGVVHPSGLRYMYATVYKDYLNAVNDADVRELSKTLLVNGTIESDESFKKVKDIVISLHSSSLGFESRSIFSRMVDALVEFFWVRYGDSPDCQKAIQDAQDNVVKSAEKNGISYQEFCNGLIINEYVCDVNPVHMRALHEFLKVILMQNPENALASADLKGRVLFNKTAQLI